MNLDGICDQLNERIREKDAEIAALQVQIKDLDEDYRGLQKACAAFEEESVAALQAGIVERNNLLEKAIKAHDNLQARVATLELALKPFADTPMTCETPGVAQDDDFDEQTGIARQLLSTSQSSLLSDLARVREILKKIICNHYGAWENCSCSFEFENIAKEALAILDKYLPK